MSIKLTEGGLQLPRWLAYNCRDEWPGYAEIHKTIRNNQNKAMVVVNSAMIMTYYEIGTIINQRKVWGNKYIERLSNDLKEYGKGYSRD